jgi:hypothetical protein
MSRFFIYAFLLLFIIACSKKEDVKPVILVPDILTIQSASVNAEAIAGDLLYNVNSNPSIIIKCSNVIDKNTVQKAIQLTETSGISIPITTFFQNGDSAIVITPVTGLKYLNRYVLSISTALKSNKAGVLNTEYQYQFQTAVDAADKFVRISDDALLDTIQKRTFYYFWEMAHPVSGLARERNASGDIVTSGGSGFGLMTIPIAINRNFISKAQGLERSKKIVSFLLNTAQKFHGAFPHWLNGATGIVVPFSAKDNGADLVETSYLMAGLLTLRQYFSSNTPDEIALRNDINTLWDGVEWTWFRKSNENVLYWHWSPSAGWDMNLQIKGWNECLITYVLAASSNTSAIPKIVYQNGFASGSSFLNGNNYYNYNLPLGPNLGGPLFWAHYSFLGLNPNGLSDAYANYQTQVENHSLINYTYSVQNPKKHFGYSESCWGLTACDIPNGYTACSPTNDIGVIAPTAAIASLPYTPEKSMKAIRYYYYTLGDKIWKEYGFMDSFSLKELWYSNTALAIDQGPIIIMIENYRSKLIWDLFTSSPEVKRGLTNLGFKSPSL